MVNGTTRTERLPATRLPSGLIRQETRFFGLPSFRQQPSAFGGRRGRSRTRIRIPAGQELAQARAREQATLRSLVAKSQTKLLTPKERAEIERITVPAAATRGQVGGGLSRLEQLRETQRRQLEGTRLRLLSEQQKLDARQSELEGRLRVLNRLKDQRLLTNPLVQKFNRDVEALSRDQTTLGKQAKTTQRVIITFQEKEQTRTGIPRTPTQFISSGLARDLVEEQRIKETIQRPFGFIDVQKQIVETEKAGREFGAAAVTPGAQFLGAVGGGVAGRVLGTIEGGASLLIDRPLFLAEKALGKPIRIQARGKEFERFFGFSQIPVLGDLLGLKQGRVTEKGVFEFGRPTLRTFGTSAALFFAPETILGAAKARVPIQSVIAKFLGPRFRPTLTFKAPTPKLRIPGAEEIKVRQILKRRGKTLREIDALFAGLQKTPTQKQLTQLLKKPKPSFIVAEPIPTTKGIEFGKFRLPEVKPFEPKGKPSDIFRIEKPPKPKRILKFKKKSGKEEISISFPKLGQRGELFPRRRPTTGQIQVPRPTLFDAIKLRASAPRVVRVRKLEDILKQFEINTGKLKPTSFSLTRGRLATGVLGAELTGAAFLSKTLEAQSTSLKDFEQLRQREITKFGTFFGPTTFTFTETTTKPIERQFARLRTPTITTTITTQPQPPITIDKIFTRPRPPPPPRRTPFIPLGFPKIEAPLGIFPGPRKVQGFIAFVKRRPFKQNKFRKVSKVLSMEAALQRGLRVADITIAQSVKIKKARKKVKFTRSFFDLRGKFRKKGKVFIEKRGFAIDTITEKQDLTVAKFLRQEKRSIFSPPRRRKKAKRRRR